MMKFLQSQPWLFDFLKRTSRALGKVNPFYLRLAGDPRLCRPLRFVQIGANDGIVDDPIREFIVRYGWRGIAIEPIPEIFAQLKPAYAGHPQVVPVNCAVSYGDDKALKLFFVKESALARFPEFAAMISSSDREHLIRHLPTITADDIGEIAVPCRTVESLVEEHGLGGVDFLHLDVEGHEANILGNLDLDRLKPEFILFENRHLAPADAARIEDKLKRHGFALESFHADMLAVRKPTN
jgi:FkbM family methyltransferase